MSDLFLHLLLGCIHFLLGKQVPPPFSRFFAPQSLDATPRIWLPPPSQAEPSAIHLHVQRQQRRGNC